MVELRIVRCKQCAYEQFVVVVVERHVAAFHVTPVGRDATGNPYQCCPRCGSCLPLADQ